VGIDKEKLRDRIIERRKDMGLTQAQLAERAQITPAAISQIESGLRTPMLPILQKLARELVCSLDYLAGVSDNPDVSTPKEGDAAQTFFREFQKLSKRDQEFIKQNIEFLKKKST